MGNIINLPNITPEIMEDLEKNSEKNSRKESTFSAKNYLDVRVNEGEKEKEVTIRLLPMDLETGNPFVKIHTHSIKVPKEISSTGYKSYICLNKTKDIDHEVYGTKCPFCTINKNAYEESLKEDDPVKKKLWQETSVANRSRESVIVRCIQRGKEDEGVKFWKFNIRHDGADPYNQIIKLYNLRKNEGIKAGLEKPINILDINEGRDLTITFSEVATAAPTVTDASISTPISKDAEQMKAWIYDSKKWQDVFAVKPYEYLELISQGLIPWYDRATGKWIDKAIHDKDVVDAENKATDDIKDAEKRLNVPQPKNDIVDELTFKEATSTSGSADEDLPF